MTKKLYAVTIKAEMVLYVEAECRSDALGNDDVFMEACGTDHKDWEVYGLEVRECDKQEEDKTREILGDLIFSDDE